MILENDLLQAQVEPKGAELRRLIRKSDNYQYLWDANPAYWAKTSPVLFPIVGALKEDTYVYQGKNYHLPRHGFARDMEFAAHRVSATCAEFTLTDSPETRAVYPFSFQLTLRYELVGSTLVCTYTVSNPDQQHPLLFSIGGHPAFAATTTERLTYDHYYLEFPADDVLNCHHVEGNLLGNEASTITLDNHRLPLSHKLFYNDALVLKSMKSKQLFLRNTVNDNGIGFAHENFPYFGIWAAKDADFVCLEPWSGIADTVQHNQQFEEKEGIQRLAAQKKWTGRWLVECF